MTTGPRPVDPTRPLPAAVTDAGALSWEDLTPAQQRAVLGLPEGAPIPRPSGGSGGR